MHAELLGCGQTDEGQLGARISEPNIRVPDRIIGAPSDADGSSVKSVACGENHTIFLTRDGKMWSVGSNVDGQLGRGKRSEGSFSIYPVSLTSGVEIIQISAGRSHSVAVGVDGRVFAWGSNDHGQLGMESSVTWQETPKRITELSEIVQVAAGADSCIALTDAGRVYVWGEQADGRCFHVPLLVEQLNAVPIVRVLSGARHCVAISASGAVFTWGQNNSGEIGMDDLRPRTFPYHVHQMDGLGVVEAACGDNHTVLLTYNGRTFSFGSDSFGQCGFGKKIEKRTNPTAVSDLIGSHVTRITAGACHTIAVIKGSVYPFGLNSSGQLGNGKFATQSTPRKTDELDHVTSVFAGYHQTFFLRSSGSIEQTEIVGPNYPVKYPMKLDRRTLEQALEDKIEAIGLFETIFSSLSSINNSFLFEDDRRYNVGFDRSHGVDLDQAMEAFLLIGESTHKKQYEDLIIDMFLMSLESWDPETATPETLRIFLILPWLSVFVENVNLDVVKKIHDPFIDALLSVNGSLATTLANWWTHLSTRHFRRLVLLLRAAARATLLGGKSPTMCEKALQLMESLSRINRVHHICPIETFYIDELSDKTVMDIQQNYFVMKSTADPRVRPQHFWSHYPFLLNGIAKSDLVHVDSYCSQQFAAHAAAMHRDDYFHRDRIESPITEIEVSRENIVVDTLKKIAELSQHDCRKPLKVKITGEDADDAGGVRKEFFLIVMNKILQQEYGMFSEDEESHLVWFSGLPSEFCERNQFHQLGRIVGLAIYNHVIVPFPFPLAIHKYLLGIKMDLEDLCQLSPTEGNGLQALLDHPNDDVEQVFCLTFTIGFSLFGEVKTVEMVPGGSEKAVTNSNRKEYVDLYVRHRLELGLDNEIEEQAKSFKKGFMDSLPSRILEYFQPRELMELVAGNDCYDWELFRETMEYKEPLTSTHPAVVTFWKAFFSLDEAEKQKFLKFLTGSDRLPVKGIRGLNAAIQRCAPESIPVAHTCFNLLDLPNLTDEKEMLRRLRISIEHTEGFTLV